MVSVFQNIGERPTAKNYHHFILLSVVSSLWRTFNGIVDNLEKCVLFSDFQFAFRSSQSTADLLTFASDKIARAFFRSGATRAVALDISKGFDRVWYAGIFHKLKSYRISGQTFGLTSSFLSNIRFWMVLNEKSSQLMLEFLKGPFLVLLFSYYTLMTFLMMLSVILLSVLMILLHTQSIIRHLIWWNSCNWLLNENLIYRTQWTRAEKDLLISIVKTDLRTVGTSLAVSLEPLAHCQNVASLSLFYRFYFRRCSSELAQLVPLSYSWGVSTRYYYRLHYFVSPFLDVTRVSISTASFLTQLHSGILWL